MGTYQSFQQAQAFGIMFNNLLSEQVASNLEQIHVITIYILLYVLKTKPHGQ